MADPAAIPDKIVLFFAGDHQAPFFERARKNKEEDSMRSFIIKKRKKSALLIMSLFFLLLPFCSAGAACKKGDANMDGDVDHADLYEIKELLRLNDACGPVPECADYDGDGSITIFDVRSVLIAISKECAPGDANSSGHLTVADLCKLEKMIADKEYSKCADCNEDGKLNAEDITCLRNKVR